jgi:hypothetical protein
MGMNFRKLCLLVTTKTDPPSGHYQSKTGNDIKKLFLPEFCTIFKVLFILNSLLSILALN